MDYSILDFLTMLGAVALFLYGMKLMSEGLQKEHHTFVHSQQSLIPQINWQYLVKQDVIQARSSPLICDASKI